MVIDAWAQPPTLGLYERMPEVHRLGAQSGSTMKALGPDELVALMDEAGIDHMILSAWHRPGQWVISNDEVYSYVERHPERFSGAAAVNLHNPVEAVRELDRAVNELGFKALRAIPWMWNLAPNDRHYWPLYVKCIELDIPFCTQVGHTGPLMPSDTGRPIPYIDEVALTFPDLTIVGGHIGYPWTDEMISLAWKHRNVYIDTSAYLPKVYPRQLVDFMQGLGARKVLFATNYPHLSPLKCRSQVDDLGLKPRMKEAFMSGNARRIFKL